MFSEGEGIPVLRINITFCSVTEADSTVAIMGVLGGQKPVQPVEQLCKLTGRERGMV